MTITVNTKAFDVKSSSETYVELQNFAVPAVMAERLKLSYTDPKPTKDYVGNGRSEVKLTFRNAAGEVVGILSMNTSIRADVAEADRLSFLATLAACGGDAKVQNMVKRGQIPFTG